MWLALFSPKMIKTPQTCLFIFFRDSGFIRLNRNDRVQQRLINRQNKSSVIQWIFIEYLKHDSTYLDVTDHV